jgi:hypothetical protein
MGREYEGLDGPLREWLTRQHVFFVATAPLAAAGHVNLSPKGLDTFTVLDDDRVAYLDLVGSGVETIAHMRENGRIVLMFCAFEGPARIVRLHGRGRAVQPGDADFVDLAARFESRPGVRSVIEVTVTRVADSCGYGVPIMEYRADRDRLDQWAAAKGPDGLAEYKATNNSVSLDGLPGVGSR